VAYEAELTGSEQQAAAASLVERLAMDPVTLIFAARDGSVRNSVCEACSVSPTIG